MDARRVLLGTRCKAFVKKDNDKLGFKARTIQGMEALVTALTGPFVQRQR